jgi:hypothetical protein
MSTDNSEGPLNAAPGAKALSPASHSSPGTSDPGAATSSPNSTLTVIPVIGDRVSQTGKPITQRESMQRAIVYFVIGLLSVTFGVILTRWAINPGVNTDSFSAAILAPVLALSGPVLGFYFHHRDDSTKD